MLAAHPEIEELLKPKTKKKTTRVCKKQDFEPEDKQ
jgi:hypothetical protein